MKHSRKVMSVALAVMHTEGFTGSWFLVLKCRLNIHNVPSHLDMHCKHPSLIFMWFTNHNSSCQSMICCLTICLCLIHSFMEWLIWAQWIFPNTDVRYVKCYTTSIWSWYVTTSRVNMRKSYIYVGPEGLAHIHVSVPSRTRRMLIWLTLMVSVYITVISFYHTHRPNGSNMPLVHLSTIRDKL